MTNPYKFYEKNRDTIESIVKSYANKNHRTLYNTAFLYYKSLDSDSSMLDKADFQSDLRLHLLKNMYEGKIDFSKDRLQILKLLHVTAANYCKNNIKHFTSNTIYKTNRYSTIKTEKSKFSHLLDSKGREGRYYEGVSLGKLASSESIDHYEGEEKVKIAVANETYAPSYKIEKEEELTREDVSEVMQEIEEYAKQMGLSLTEESPEYRFSEFLKKVNDDISILKNLELKDRVRIKMWNKQMKKLKLKHNKQGQLVNRFIDSDVVEIVKGNPHITPKLIIERLKHKYKKINRNTILTTLNKVRRGYRTA